MLVKDFTTSFYIKTRNFVSLFFYSSLVIYITILFCTNASANNAYYTSLSNYVAKKKQIDVVANNLANVKTNGFEEDNILFKEVKKKSAKNKYNSFVGVNSSYISREDGDMTSTGRNLDIAVYGGYLKVKTPKGYRYTLNGNIIVNRDGILVTSSGYPYMSNADSEININRDDINLVYIGEDGTIYVSGEEVDKIGVFSLDRKSLVKEGNVLYKNLGYEEFAEDFKVSQGYLRSSNVSQVKASIQMIDLQHSVKSTNSILRNVSNFETDIVNRILK